MSAYDRVTVPTSEAIANLLEDFWLPPGLRHLAPGYGNRLHHMLLLGRGRAHLTEAMLLWWDIEIQLPAWVSAHRTVLDELEEYGWL